MIRLNRMNGTAAMANKMRSYSNDPTVSQNTTYAGFDHGPVGQPHDLSLDIIFRTMWRRKTVIASTAGLVLASAIFYVSNTTPRYTTEALVQIEPASNTIIGIETIAGGISDDQASVLGEVQVIRSRSIAGETISRLGLASDDNGTADADRALGLFRILSVEAQPNSAPPPRKTAKDQLKYSARIDSFLQTLKVQQVNRSNVVSIGFTSTKPTLAATVVNTIADLYIENQLERKRQTTQLASDWINERLAELEGQVQDSEQDIETFRAKVGLVEGVNAPLLTEQVSRLNTELAIAQAQSSETEARLAEVNSLTGQDVDAVAAVLQSAAIQNLRAKSAEISRQRADVATRYGPEHPIWSSLNAEIVDLEKKITEEIGRVVGNLSSEARVARARVVALAAHVGELEIRSTEASRAGVALRALERDAEADRRLYELFLARYKETTLQDGIQQPDARVVSYADVPASPSHPKKALVLAVAAVLAGLLGLTFALVAEQLDTAGFRHISEMEQLLGLPAFGSVPQLSDGEAKTRKPEDYLIAQPQSRFAEAIRGIRTGMFLSRGEQPPPQVTLFTSSVPNEGKTTLTVCLARMLAGIGERVVVLDCDTRLPRVHQVFGVDNKAGLVDFLKDTGAEGPNIHTDARTKVDYITAGVACDDGSELLQSDRFQELLTLLRKDYSVVLIDSPPVLAVADARVLCQMCDAVVYVATWRKTRRDRVKSGVELLPATAPNLIGLVLNKVDLKQQARYGYADAYCKEYSPYHSG